MNLSKIGKRIIAVTMTAAVVVSGIVFSPNKTIKAADTEPQVRVLGATLRTEGNKTGTQSLRVGIEVINASYASECGIKVKVKGSEKETVVSTANEKYQKLYSKDVEADKIVYSVVIENIPVEKASSEIEFIGFVNNIETPTEIFAQTDTVSKSVNGVVQSMSNSLGKDVILLDSGDYAGTLVYEYAKLDMSAAHSNLEMPDKEGNYSSGKFVVGKDEARAQCEYVDSGDGAPYYKVITPAAGEKTENTQGKGIGYIHQSMAETDSYIYSAEVKADTGVALNLVTYWGWNTWREAGHEGKAVDCNGEWKKVEIKTSNQASYDNSNYFSTANTGAKEYCIKNVVIYKVFSDADMPEIEEQNNIELLDLHKFQANGTAPVDEPVIYNEDGSMTITYAHSYTGSNIPISKYLANYKSVSIYIESKKADGTSAGNQMVLKYSDGTEDVRYGNGEFSLVVPDGKTLNSIMINPQDASEDNYQTTTIKYIRLSKINDLDLSTISVTDGSVMTINEDSTVSIACNGNYTGGITIDIPSEVATDAKSVNINIDAYNKDGDKVGDGQIQLHYDTGTFDTVYNWSADGHDDTVFNVDNSKGTPTKIVMNNQDTGTTFVIKSIKISY